MHLKKIAMPKTWPLQKKDKKFIIRGKGAIKQELSLPLLIVLRDLLKIVATRAETKKILKEKVILVNGKVAKDEKLKVGLFDRIEIKKLNKFFTLHFTESGKLNVVEISKERSETKPCKIIGKKILSKNRLQINCDDGRNFIISHKAIDKNFKVGDTLIIFLKTNTIKEHLKLCKGAFVLIISGKNMGKHGKIEDLDEKTAWICIKNKKILVPKKNLIVLEESELKNEK